MKHLEAKFDQMKISLEEESRRRSTAEAENERLRDDLQRTTNNSNHDIETLRRALDELRI